MLGDLAGPGIDAADLYFQGQISESWALEDGIVKEGSFNLDQGVGVRAQSGEKTGFAYSNAITLEALGLAARAARSISRAGQNGTVQAFTTQDVAQLYGPDNPLEVLSRAEKVELLKRIDVATRALDPRIQQVSVSISYNEALSHQIMAGCDLFIMPSRFEPCGLNQMYGLAYGTPPVVNATGGLADTVVDTNLISFKNKSANGFVMSEASSTSLLNAIKQALNVYKNDQAAWKQIQINGMNLDLSWDKSALAYLAAYESLLMPNA